LAEGVPESHTGRVIGTTETELLPLCGESLFAVGARFARYRRLRDGAVLYVGERPGVGWHAHGTTARRLLCLERGIPVRIVLRKPRWRHAATGVTCHSRPPDDLPGARSCSLVVVLLLWSWLSSEVGLWRQRAVLRSLESAVSLRTLQRWMRRALRLARETQQTFRAAVLQRNTELRPGESLLPRGRGPPNATFRRWGEPGAASTLYQGLSIAVSGAIRLVVPLACLLAEAHGRWTAAEDRFVL
jgi:hypothetical protein